MPTILAEQNDLDIQQGGWLNFNLNVSSAGGALELIVTCQNENDDVDIYCKIYNPPTLTDYNYKKDTVNNPEGLMIWETQPNHYRFGIYGFNVTGKIDVLFQLYSIYEYAAAREHSPYIASYMASPTDTVKDVEDDTTIIDTTVNNDLTQITNEISSGFDTLADDFRYSVNNLSNDIKNSNSEMSNSIINALRSTSGDIAGSIDDSSYYLRNGLTDLSGRINTDLSELEYGVRTAIDRNTEAIRNTTPEPVVIALREIAGNIKGISNNTIDEFLLTYFGEKKV